MKYLETCSVDPYYNLAFEEYVLKNCRDDDYLILWQNDNTIVFGVNQNPLEEIIINKAKEEHVNIVRRTTGGGAVYHDMGNLNFSYITDWNDGENSGYEFFLTPITEAFAKISITIDIQGRNDLTIEGKKVSGNAQRLLGDRILHHGTLLINSDLSRIGRFLNVSREKIESKGIKSVQSRVANISDFTDEELNVEYVKKLLKDMYFSHGVEVEVFDKKICQDIQRIADDKYRSWEWTYGRSPKFNYKNRKRFSGGILEANLDVHEGKINECIIRGDFLSLKDIRDIEAKLKGIRYDAQDIKKALDTPDFELYFGTITKSEALNCFMDV